MPETSRAQWSRLLVFVAVAGFAGGSTCPAHADERDGARGRIRVVSTARSPDADRRCREVLEAALPVYEAHLPHRLPPGASLVVRLYGTDAEYDAAVAAAGAPGLARHGAATVSSTSETLVTLRPRDDPEVAGAFGGLCERTRFVVAHEGVHQFLRRAGAKNIDEWPDWYAEGMAEFLAGECLRAGRAPTSPLVVVEDARHRVQDALARGRMMRLPWLLHVRTSSFEDFPSFYAHAADFYRLLAADPQRLVRLHAAVRDLDAPGDTWDARAAALSRAFEAALVRTYGPIAALEARWVESVREARPACFEFGRCNEHAGDEIVSAALPGRNAALLRAVPREGSALTIDFEMNVLPVGDRQADVILAFERRDDPRFLKVALGPGFATLLAFSDGHWHERFRRNADLPADACAPGRWIPVRVRVEASRVQVRSGDREWLDAEVPPGFDPTRGAFGVGVTDSACRFRRLEAKSTPLTGTGG
jgi:hypothetical protein